MATAVNGWRVITRAECVDIDVPGGVLPVHPRAAPIFRDLAYQWHQRVEPLQWPGCWGWSPPRPIRKGTVTSTHCAGVGVDLSAPLHPQGKAAAATLSPDQLAVIRGDLIPRYHGVLEWGGDWGLPDTDAMHWQVSAQATLTEIDALCASLTGGIVVPAPAPSPPAPGPAPAGWTGPDLTGSALALRGVVGNSGPRVQALQGWLRGTFPLYAKNLDVDGEWGPQTTGVLREFAQRSSIRTADGLNIGPQLARRLYLSGFRG